MNAILLFDAGYDALHGKNLNNTFYLRGLEQLLCIQDKGLVLFS